MRGRKREQCLINHPAVTVTSVPSVQNCLHVTVVKHDSHSVDFDSFPRILLHTHFIFTLFLCIYCTIGCNQEIPVHTIAPSLIQIFHLRIKYLLHMQYFHFIYFLYICITGMHSNCFLPNPSLFTANTKYHKKKWLFPRESCQRG